MIVKAAVYDVCKECGTRKRVISDEEYGCDKCGAPIPLYDNQKGVGYLHATIHYQDDRQSKNIHFCSWDCCLSYIQKIQRSPDASNYFISLNFTGFWNAVKRQRTAKRPRKD